MVAITSPSTEDGRTTLAVDLAATLAESGKNVVLVDGDLRGSSLAERLPLSGPAREAAAARGLSTTIAGETSVVEAVIPDVQLGHHRVAFLPTGPLPSRPGELWASDRATDLLDDLGDAYDYVIIDTPPLGQYSDGALVSALADGALLVARIRRTTSSALRRAVQTPGWRQCNPHRDRRDVRTGAPQAAEPVQSRRRAAAVTGSGPPPSDDTTKITTTDAETEGLVGSTGTQRIPRPRHGSG